MSDEGCCVGSLEIDGYFLVGFEILSRIEPEAPPQTHHHTYLHISHQPGWGRKSRHPVLDLGMHALCRSQGDPVCLLFGCCATHSCTKGHVDERWKQRTYVSSSLSLYGLYLYTIRGRSTSSSSSPPTTLANTLSTS